ncbi:hypothetical protein [Sinorhizobium meliloti]|uniref:hypothetical protein n=1 Tax=Rhizobium meliloti TaxID=382 RepID=UPI001F401733|nr:hypothetical protein [Sinorhizobium meliloti]
MQAIASTDIRLLFEPLEVITEDLFDFIEEVYNKRRLHSARLLRPQKPRINIFGRLAINSLLYVQGAHSNKGQYSIPFNKSPFLGSAFNRWGGRLFRCCATGKTG